MSRILPAAVSLLAALAMPAFAAAPDADPQARVARLENESAQLEGRRVRLEHESSDLGAEIERVKSEPAGVRRDFKLRELLAQSKTGADELTRVAGELRTRSAPLAEARRQLIAACDRALASPALNEARRLELARLRTAQAALLANPAAPLGKLAPVSPLFIDPLDGPRELKEKADLLRDSEDKLKREVQRLTSRIDDVERRRHLRERIGAVDEDLFGEATSNRKFARVGSGIQAAHDPKTSQGSSDSAGNPAPAPGISGGGTTGGTTGGGGGGMPTGGFTNGPGTPTTTPSGETGGSRATDSTVLRNLVDPSTLDELRRSDGGDDLDRQVRALKRAQGELEGMAAELERRARSLSSRADELKRQK